MVASTYRLASTLVGVVFLARRACDGIALSVRLPNCADLALAPEIHYSLERTAVDNDGYTLPIVIFGIAVCAFADSVVHDLIIVASDDALIINHPIPSIALTGA